MVQPAGEKGDGCDPVAKKKVREDVSIPAHFCTFSAFVSCAVALIHVTSLWG